MFLAGIFIDIFNYLLPDIDGFGCSFFHMYVAYYYLAGVAVCTWWQI